MRGKDAAALPRLGEVERGYPAPSFCSAAGHPSPRGVGSTAGLSHPHPPPCGDGERREPRTPRRQVFHLPLHGVMASDAT